MTIPKLPNNGTTINGFEYWVQRTMPIVYDDSLSYYELLAKVVAHLNTVGKQTNDLTALWNEVNEWMMNEGLNEAVVNKLDVMANDGTLDRIINENIFEALNKQITDLTVNVMSFGAKGDGVTDDSFAFQKAFDSASNVLIPRGFTFRIAKQVFLNGNQNVLIDGDIFVDLPGTLLNARQIDAFKLIAFVNKKGFATAEYFIAEHLTLMRGYNNIGKFQPNDHFTAKHNGEVGISINQRSGRIYSNRSRYSTTDAPYAFLGLFFVENCTVKLSNMDNLGAGVIAHHALGSEFDLTGQNIGTDFNNSTLFLGGSYGCVFMAKALVHGCKVKVNGHNCNDVATFDGLCRYNNVEVISTCDKSGENHRVFELSDGSNFNTATVVANGGGGYEVVVLQDNCAFNDITVQSDVSIGKGINLKRGCNYNTINGTIKDWSRGNPNEEAAVYLAQVGTSNPRPCVGNQFNLKLIRTLSAGTNSVQGILEVNEDPAKDQTGNIFKIDQNAEIGGFRHTYTANNVENYEVGNLYEKLNPSKNNYMGEREGLQAGVNYDMFIGGITSSASIMPEFKSRLSHVMGRLIGSITAGTVTLKVQRFDSTVWVDLVALPLTKNTPLSTKKYSECKALGINKDQGVKLRVEVSADYVGEASVIANLGLSEII